MPDTFDTSDTSDTPDSVDTAPLAGMRVVSIAVNLPGPLAAARLSDLGAEVTKVEPPTGDPLRAVAPDAYEELSRSQLVVTLDLKTATGQAALLDLVGVSDLLLTSSRPASLERLGLGWAQLHARIPRLCQVAISGSLVDGGGQAGHDLTYQARAGLVDPGHQPRVLVADLAGAERAVSEAVTALLHRERTGTGTRREVGLAEVASEMARPMRWGLTTSAGPLGGGLPAYRTYPARTGYVALAALEPHFWERVRSLLDIEGTAEDLQRIFATKDAAEWEAWAGEHDVPLVRVAEDP